VTSVNDILQIIAPQLLEEQSTLALGENPLQVRILELLQQGLRDGDELQRGSEAGPSEFATELTMMELNGQIRALGANQWTLK
jgi:predicted Rossmann fold nucleotide-binding protein DprA/Smf involved in DNA uptake